MTKQAAFLGSQGRRGSCTCWLSRRSWIAAYNSALSRTKRILLLISVEARFFLQSAWRIFHTDSATTELKMLWSQHPTRLPDARIRSPH